MLSFKVIATDRLYLKILNPADFKYIFEYWSMAEVKELFGLENDEQYFIEKMKSDGGYETYDRTVLVFFMIDKSSGKTIGRGGFHNWYKAHKKAEIGYAILDDANKRKGYMTEAVKAIIDYGFDVLELNRIEASTSTDNIASMAILKKFSFVKEGYFKQHYIRDKEAEDSIFFALLREDYYASGQ